MERKGNDRERMKKKITHRKGKERTEKEWKG